MNEICEGQIYKYEDEPHHVQLKRNGLFYKYIKILQIGNGYLLTDASETEDSTYYSITIKTELFLKDIEDRTLFLYRDIIKITPKKSRLEDVE